MFTVDVKQQYNNNNNVFIDFKNAFDRIWHAALWVTMRKNNISANLVHTTEQLYGKATSAVQMNGSMKNGSEPQSE